MPLIRPFILTFSPLTLAAIAAPLWVTPTQAQVTVTPQQQLAQANSSPLETQILHELNRVRTNPIRYAIWLESLRQYYDGTVLLLPGQAPLETQEGVAALDEAINDLRQRRPVLPLSTSDQLSQQAQTALLNNSGGNQVLLADSSSTAPMWAVMRFVVADGQRDRAPRHNLLSTAHRSTGVACRTGGNLCSLSYDNTASPTPIAVLPPNPITPVTPIPVTPIPETVVTPLPPITPEVTVETTPAPSPLPDATVDPIASTPPTAELPDLTSPEVTSETLTTPPPDVATDPVAIEPVAIDPVAIDPVAVEPVDIPPTPSPSEVPVEPTVPEAHSDAALEPIPDTVPETSPVVEVEPTPDSTTEPIATLPPTTVPDAIVEPTTPEPLPPVSDNAIDSTPTIPGPNPTVEVASLLNPDPQALAQGYLFWSEGALEANDQRYEDGSFYDEHLFQGGQGQSITIDLSSNEFDTFLAVFDANGQQVLAQNDDAGGSSNSSVTMTLPYDGLYRIFVNGYNESDLGSYALSIQ